VSFFYPFGVHACFLEQTQREREREWCDAERVGEAPKSARVGGKRVVWVRTSCSCFFPAGCVPTLYLFCNLNRRLFFFSARLFLCCGTPQKNKKKGRKSVWQSFYLFFIFFFFSRAFCLVGAERGTHVKKKKQQQYSNEALGSHVFFPIHLFLLLVGRSVFSFFSSFDYFASSSPLSLLSLADHNCSFFSPQARVVSFFSSLEVVYNNEIRSLPPVCFSPL